MTSIAIEQLAPSRRKPATPKPLAAVLLVAAADILLYGQPAGMSLVLFAAALAAGVFLMQPGAMRSRGALWRLAGAAVAIAPLAENVSVLSVMVSMTGLAVVALSCAHRLAGGIAETGRRLARFLAAMPFRAVADLIRARRQRRRLGKRRVGLDALLTWAMPVGMGLVFVVLFGLANPLIEHWLEMIDPWLLLSRIEPARLVFWIVATAVVWAYLRPRLLRQARRPAAGTAADAPARDVEKSAFFGRAALLRALIVFNLIFAVQTMLDVAYLWGGAALPGGMTYAEYAHRGAYPLIATALLAACFVLAAMRPGSDTQADPLIRRLVYLWVAQNVMLVLSSILRLDLYVGVYSLTYWRVAAFLWMALVGAGLVLIMARIALGRSNEWLASANLLSLSALLYGCCFINFAALIAGYNVDHSREMAGQGVAMDQYYIAGLGPQAIPAMDRLAARLPALCYDGADSCFAGARRAEERELRHRMTNWRAWTFRNQRLMRYLDARPAPTAPPETRSCPNPIASSWRTTTRIYAT